MCNGHGCPASTDGVQYIWGDPLALALLNACTLVVMHISFQVLVTILIGRQGTKEKKKKKTKKDKVGRVAVCMYVVAVLLRPRHPASNGITTFACP